MYKKFTSDPKQLFLLDGLGAVLSAVFLGIVLVKLEAYIGMPRSVLYTLSSMACLYAIYSISCYFLLKNVWRPYLRIIAIANLIHCFITIGLVFFISKN